VLLTLHNPYDHLLSDEVLAAITNRTGTRRWPLVHAGNRTMLARMIPLFDGPISTVSRRFAQELTNDPLQTAHFAAHYARSSPNRASSESTTGSSLLCRGRIRNSTPQSKAPSTAGPKHYLR